LIVDDSKLMRRVIADILEKDSRLEVAGEAADGNEALEKIAELTPDVVTLDINMPRMDGITALKHIMIKHPTPTVMLSTLTQEGADITFDALRFGAVDFVHKPSNRQPEELENQAQAIVRKVILAADVKLDAVRLNRGKPKPKAFDAGGGHKCKHLCALGASEGGYGALLKVIPHLHPALPAAVLAVLYEASPHVDAFTGYLDKNSAFTVKRAKDGTTIEPGVCYIASGKEYLTVYSFYGEYSLSVNASPFPTRRGSINMLLLSLAERAEQNAVGVLLSGAGDDGAEGVCEVMRLGGAAIVQDPETCLHREMPEAAIAQCNGVAVHPDTQIAAALNKRLSA
jgi:two-component system chemotaxis response regulator CheB